MKCNTSKTYHARLIAVTASLMLIAPLTATAQMARVAVVAFREVPGAVTLGPGFEGVVWEIERTRNLAAVLGTALTKTGKFRVMERFQLSTVNEERLFAELTTGRLVSDFGFGAAEYVVVGELVRLDAYVSQTPIPYTSRIIYRAVGNMSLNVRFVSVASGQVLAAQKVDGRLVLNNPGSPQGFLDALQDAAIEQAVVYLLDVAYPAKIINVEGDIVYINRGEGGGFALGQRLNLCRVGKPMRDPDTGKSLGPAETVIGQVEVIEIQPKFTKARVVTPLEGQSVEAGMICRTQQMVPAPPRLDEKPSDAPLKWE